MEELLEIVISLFAGVGSFAPLIGLAGYVFSSLALYDMAQRRGLGKPWLAWIPVLNLWTLGSLSDQYRYVVREEVRSKRKILLAVGILGSLWSLITTVRMVVMIFSALIALGDTFREEQLIRLLMNGLINGLLWSIPGIVLGIVRTVFEIMALYDVYTACAPANNVLYLVLSIIPGVSKITRPLFLFLCRDRDEGMPPRRETVEEF